MSQNGLFGGEALQMSVLDEPFGLLPTEDEIVKRYVSGEIRIVTEQARTQLTEIPSIIDSGRYLLRPEYQRRRRWGTAKQSRLIESFLMNVPVPPVFLYEFEYARYEVMDGLQRLSSLQDFYNDALELTGLEYWTELNGHRYSTLPSALQQGIDRRFISTIVLLNETASSEIQAQRLKELVFERINSGGVSLTAQESRNALSNGPLNEKLPALARTPSFCKAWGIPEPSLRELAGGEPEDDVLGDPRYQSMEDVEMVLRFFAHRQRAQATGAFRNLKPFLDAYWTEANKKFTPEMVDQIGSIFQRTADLAYAVLGESAFYLRRERDYLQVWVPRPTLVAYDSVMAAFSRHLEHAQLLIRRRDLVQERISDLYDEHKGEFDGRKTGPRDLEARDALISRMLEGVVRDV